MTHANSYPADDRGHLKTLIADSFTSYDDIEIFLHDHFSVRLVDISPNDKLPLVVEKLVGYLEDQHRLIAFIHRLHRTQAANASVAAFVADRRGRGFVPQDDLLNLETALKNSFSPSVVATCIADLNSYSGAPATRTLLEALEAVADSHFEYDCHNRLYPFINDLKAIDVSSGLKSWIGNALGTAASASHHAPHGPGARVGVAERKEGDRLWPTLSEFFEEKGKLKHLLVGILLFTLLTFSTWYVIDALNPQGGNPQRLGIAQLFLVCAMLLEFVLIAHSEKPIFSGSGIQLEQYVSDTAHRHPSSVWGKYFRSAELSQKQFFGGVITVLTGWLLLYSAYLARHFPAAGRFENALRIFETSGNNVATLGMFLCFYVMAFVTTPAAAQSGRPRSLLLVGFLGWTMVFAFSAMNTVVALNSTSAHDAQRVFDLASGLAAAVVFALWVGRFDSKFIDGNPGVLVALYAYAAIQPLWIIVPVLPHGILGFGNTPALILLGAAFCFKLLLFAFLVWLIRSGRLLFYFGEVRSLYEKVQQAWNVKVGLPAGNDVRPQREGHVTSVMLLAMATLFLIAFGAWRAGAESTSKVVGRWRAEVDWNKGVAKRLNLLPDGVDEVEPRSTGVLLVSGDEGHPSLSYWVFQNLASDDPKDDPAAALLAVHPQSPKTEGDNVEIHLNTWHRVKYSQTALGPKTHYYLRIEPNPKEDGTLSGHMCASDCEGSNSLGTVTLKPYPDRKFEGDVPTR